MFRNVHEFFSTSVGLEVQRSGLPTGQELQVAVVALLIEMAGSDQEFAPQELDRIVRLMLDEFGLKPDQTAQMVEMVQFMRRDGTKIERFIAAVNEHFSVQQRQVVLAMIWKLVEADGKIEDFEVRLAAGLRQRLNLSLEQATLARQLAENTDLSQLASAEAEEN